MPISKYMSAEPKTDGLLDGNYPVIRLEFSTKSLGYLERLIDDCHLQSQFEQFFSKIPVKGLIDWSKTTHKSDEVKDCIVLYLHYSEITIFDDEGNRYCCAQPYYVFPMSFEGRFTHKDRIQAYVALRFRFIHTKLVEVERGREKYLCHIIRLADSISDSFSGVDVGFFEYLKRFCFVLGVIGNGTSVSEVNEQLRSVDVELVWPSDGLKPVSDEERHIFESLDFISVKRVIALYEFMRSQMIRDFDFVKQLSRVTELMQKELSSLGEAIICIDDSVMPYLYCLDEQTKGLTDSEAFLFWEDKSQRDIWLKTLFNNLRKGWLVVNLPAVYLFSMSFYLNLRYSNSLIDVSPDVLPTDVRLAHL